MPNNKTLFPALQKSNVSDKLKVIQNKEIDDTRFVDYKKIRPSELNKYPIVDIERLAESLKTWGLIHNLLLVKIEEPDSEYEYEILSGERRYAAIGHLLSMGDETFKNGIRARIINNSDDIDKEIMLIEANEEVRDDDPVRRRQMIQRLEELYIARAEKNGTSTNTISKDISSQIGIGERQVQRYRAVNTLIPELTDAFDKGNVSLEKAASLSKLSEDAQKVIANLLGEFKNTEIDLLKQEAERLSKEKDSQRLELTAQIESLKNQYEEEKISLAQRIDEQNKQLEINLKEDEELKIKLEREISLKNNEKIKELEKQLSENSDERDKLLNDKKELETERKNIEKSLSDKDKQISELKEKLKLADKPETLTLSKEDQKKLRLKFELQNVIADVRKSINNLIVKSENYHKLYDDEEQDIDNSIKDLLIYMNDKLSSL